MNFLRPSVNMLAETMGYTFEDWSSTDFSDFSLRVNGSTVSVKNDEVQVLVYQGGAQIGAKSFSVHRLNDDYYFSDPSSVKNWAYNFVDVADYTDVKFDLEKQSSGVITVAAVENNISKASASTYYKGEAYCEGSICYEEP